LNETFEKLVTDFEGVKSDDHTDDDPHMLFEFDNGYSVTVVRTDTPEAREKASGVSGYTADEIAAEYEKLGLTVGTFEVCLWKAAPNPFYAMLFGNLVPVRELTDLTTGGGSIKGSLTNAGVNEFLSKVSQLPAVSQ